MKQRTIHIATIVIVLSLIVASVYFFTVQAPLKRAYDEVSALIQERYQLTAGNQFYQYTGEEATFAVSAFDAAQQPYFVIVHRATGDSHKYAASELFSETAAIAQVQNDIKPRRILAARLGWQNNRPVWEVAYRDDQNRLGYYTIDAQDGTLIKDIGNI